MDKYDVVVTGAGASGLIAAGKLAEYGLKVCLLEKKTRPGIKLSITGKGRCNITNSADIREFISAFGPNGKFLYSAFSKFFNTDTVSFFEELGVPCRLERGGRYFPQSNDAHDIVNALIKYVKKNNCRIYTSVNISGFSMHSGRLKSAVSADGKEFFADNFIIATGGKSYPLTGSQGDGYIFAKTFGHTVTEPMPALVPLVSDSPYLKTLNRLKLKNIEITIYADNKKVSSSFGETEFTSYGLTGPLILTASSSVYKMLKENKNVVISVNLKPALDDKQLDARLVRELASAGTIPVRTMLKNLIPLQMTEPFMKESGIRHTELCSNINREKRKKIFKTLRGIKFKITGTRPIDEAIITRGGIALNEVEQNTMKSKLINNLYFCGEILDLDGPTGGFNLQEAFSTGYLAAVSIGENK